LGNSEFCAIRIQPWNVKLDTLDAPQLRTLDCYLSDLRGLNAPNLSRLRVRGYVSNFPSGPTPTTTNIRHVHLNYASVRAIYSTALIFPHMKTLAVVHINDGSESDPVTRSCLGIQSMTLPVFPHAHTHIQPKIIAIFNGLHLPMLQNLILAA
jgi:hypothetical protein